MNFKVQWLNKSKMWVTMMSGYRMEQEAIRYAEVRARQIAESLSLPIIEWNIKSTTKAQQGLYEYDAVSRLRDSQLGDVRV